MLEMGRFSNNSNGLSNIDFNIAANHTSPQATWFYDLYPRFKKYEAGIPELKKMLDIPVIEHFTQEDYVEGVTPLEAGQYFQIDKIKFTRSHATWKCYEIDYIPIISIAESICFPGISTDETCILVLLTYAYLELGNKAYKKVVDKALELDITGTYIIWVDNYKLALEDKKLYDKGLYSLTEAYNSMLNSFRNINKIDQQDQDIFD